MIRSKSFGQDYRMTVIDRWGTAASHRRITDRIRKMKRPVCCLDIGCGYRAGLLQKLLPFLKEGVGIDVSISDELKQIDRLKFIEKPIETALQDLENESFDVILMCSVLEHLEDPAAILKRCYRCLAGGGLLLVNVPTWTGKIFLEFSAFRLGLSPAAEMDDHKMYYGKKDLWPLLVRAGFKPSRIHMRYHKFGLNLFAVVGK